MPQLNNIRTVSVPSLGKIPLGADPGTFTPSGFNREHKPGRLPEDGGYTESSQPAVLAININLQSGIDLDALNAITSEDVTIRLGDGHVYLMSQAFINKPVGFGNGDSQVEFMSNTSERIA
ncbi:MAG: phage tail protein [Methylomonas sp.]|nr:MAG: phage tail protein [Methylomonas sp.]